MAGFTGLLKVIFSGDSAEFKKTTKDISSDVDKLVKDTWSSWTKVITDGNRYEVTTTSASKTLTIREYCYVTAAGQTITLPPDPTAGTYCFIAVGNFRNTIVNPNGKTIQGQSSGETLTIDVSNCTIQFVCLNTNTWGVRYIHFRTMASRHVLKNPSIVIH